MAKKTTSKTIAKKASTILKDNRYSKTAKSVAGSALSQREKKKQEKSLGASLQKAPFIFINLNLIKIKKR